MTNGTAYFA